MSLTYLDHFGLHRAPFDITPDPALLQNPPGHERVLEWLEGGIAARVPVLLLTGDPGTGKTTLLRLLRSRHRSDWIVGLIWHLYPRGEDIRLQASRALGLQDRRNDSPAFLSTQIRRFAEKMRAEGKFTVLIVDDAQALAIASLSALASLVTDGPDSGALTVLLVGKPELRVMLAASESLDLRIKESARAVLAPFSESDTLDYIAHQIAQSGADAPIFDSGAMQMLHAFSHGVPRLINIMADYCLRTAAADELLQLDAAWVRAVLEEATTIGVLGHIGGAGTEPPQPVTVDALAMPIRRIQAEAQYATSPNTADDMDRAVPPVVAAPKIALTAADTQATHPVAERGREAAAPRADPISRNPPARISDASRTTHEPGAKRRLEEVAVHAADVLVGPVRVAARRNPGKRRGLSWAAAAATMVLAGGAAFLWLQREWASSPVAAVAARPSADAAVEQTDSRATRQSTLRPAAPALQTATPAPRPVAITPEPSVAALMTQALEIEARNPAGAIVAYARAAIRGRSRAAYFLGQFYETGTGVEPSPGMARLWYAAAPELAASRRRLQALSTADASVGTPATPVPTFQARLSNGASEMIWHVPGGVTPARFRVETLGLAGESLPPQETIVPGLILRSPVSGWRVTAIGADGAESAPSAMVAMIPAEK